MRAVALLLAFVVVGACVYWVTVAAVQDRLRRRWQDRLTEARADYEDGRIDAVEYEARIERILAQTGRR